MSGLQNAAFEQDDPTPDMKLTELQRADSTDEAFTQSNHDLHNNEDKQIKTIFNQISDKLAENKRLIKICLLIILNILVITYFGFATSFYLEKESNCYGDCGMDWCDGYGMLVLLVSFVYFGIIYFQILKPLMKKYMYKSIIEPTTSKLGELFANRLIKIICGCVLLIAFALFCIFETASDRRRLMSLAGMAVLLCIAFLISKHPTKVNLRPVIFGITFQFLLGLFCIRWEVGRNIFSCIGRKVATFLNYSADGAAFVYGDFLVRELGLFAFYVLSVIYFFSFCISILYYTGTMQWVVIKLGWFLQSILGSTVCESVIAAANIFLGMSESCLLILPYLKDLTHSEIHAIMASGFATVSGSVLAAYISFGADPAHLITSSVMAAPAALCISKIVYPEVEVSRTRSDNIKMEKSTDSSILDAATNGASTATGLVLGILANLIAFVSFISFINGLLSWFGFLVGYEGITLEGIFGTIFRPLAFVMGVPWDESEYVGKLIGIKTIINEFVAYERLGQYKEKLVISKRSAAIATYAICGFANPSSLGILIGALSAMAPTKRSTITACAIRAFVCGSIVCFMTACIAGLLMNENIFNDIG